MKAHHNDLALLDRLIGCTFSWCTSGTCFPLPHKSENPENTTPSPSLFPSISPSRPTGMSTSFGMRALSFVALGIAACFWGQALAFHPPGSVYTPTRYAASSTIGLAKTHAQLHRSIISSGALQPRKWRVDWGMRATSIGSSDGYAGVRRDGRGRSGRSSSMWI